MAIKTEFQSYPRINSTWEKKGKDLNFKLPVNGVFLKRKANFKCSTLLKKVEHTKYKNLITMKKLTFHIVFPIIISLIIISCQTENNFDNEPILTENFKKEFSNINWKSTEILNPSISNDENPDIDFTLIQLNNSNSYFVEFESKCYFIDQSNIENEINIYNVKEPNNQLIFPVIKESLLPYFNSINVILTAILS